MSEALAKQDGGFTWDDYRSWDDGQRWEIIGGEAFAMSPAPTTRHQSAAMALSAQLYAHFRNRPCRVYAAPTDVKLSAEDVVQPDLLVVCETDKIKPTHIEGAPTLVMEIVSPSSSLVDRNLKMRLYAKAGVKEVWLVTPYPCLVELYVLDGSSFRLIGTATRDDKATSPTFPGLIVDLKPVFDFPMAPEEEALLVREAHPPYPARHVAAPLPAK